LEFLVNALVWFTNRKKKKNFVVDYCSDKDHAACTLRDFLKDFMIVVVFDYVHYKAVADSFASNLVLANLELSVSSISKSSF